MTNTSPSTCHACMHLSESLPRMHAPGTCLPAGPEALLSAVIISAAVIDINGLPLRLPQCIVTAACRHLHQARHGGGQSLISTLGRTSCDVMSNLVAEHHQHNISR